MHINLEQDEVLSKHAFAIADKQAELLNEYCKLYIKNRPKWLPEFLYKWIIGKVLVLARFNKPN